MISATQDKSQKSRRASNFIDLTGRKFGRLIVISYAQTHKKRVFWNVRCECGTEKIVEGAPMKSGLTASCGCLHDETARENRRTHGLARRGKKHQLYQIWKGMRARCNDATNLSWPRYGGRGVSVCKKWDDFGEFVRDMGPKPTSQHSLDRIDNDGNYEPSNCRWATKKEQANNTRSNVLITFQGETRTIPQWAELFAMTPKLISNRVRAKWPVDKIFTKEKRVNQFS